MSARRASVIPEPLASIQPMLLSDFKGSWTDSPDCTYELKYDGYRLLASTDTLGGSFLRTRNGANATAWFPEIVRGLSELTGPGYVFDGEVCVLDELGRSDFDLLHDRALTRSWKPGLPLAVYCIFDILFRGHDDLRPLPLSSRKQILADVLAPGASSILHVTGFTGQGSWLFEQARALKLEGIVAKRLDAPYLSGQRTNDWLKRKPKGAIPPQRFRRGVEP